MHPAERIRKELEMPLARIPDGPNLSDMMSGTQSVNELVRPVHARHHQPATPTQQEGNDVTRPQPESA